jgi:hypothetical protein
MQGHMNFGGYLFNNSPTLTYLNTTDTNTRTWLGTNATRVSNLENNVSPLQTEVAGLMNNVSPLQAAYSHIRAIAGGTAGNHIVSGLAAASRLSGVQYLTNNACVDLSSEFLITAENTINNVNGSPTTGGALLVSWYGPNAAPS